MATAEFIHLRVHSAYSLSEGALRIGEIVQLCKAARMPAVAITDSNNLFGALEFSSACKDAGIQPIIGCQLALSDEPGKRVTAHATFDQIVLLAQDEIGYSNLMRLASRAFLDPPAGRPPHITWPALESHAAGLLALTGAPASPLGRALLNGQRAAGDALVARLRAVFGDRLYIEIGRHGTPEERRIERALIDLAYASKVPLVATNEAFFGDETMFEAHDALLCIAQGTFVAENDRVRLTPEHRFKTAAEMKALFADLPEAIANTVVIAQRCAVMAESSRPILPPFPTEPGRSEAEQLRALAVGGLERRLDRYVRPAHGVDFQAAAKPYRDRLAYELGVIEQMGFPGYFLIVADFVNWAKRQGIPVGPGRGSGAGSVTAWALEITDLDPLRWNLLFERFLNPDRVSMPDFDIDFCQDRRDEVIGYVRERYGRDRVAQIITFGKLQARAVLRDVGRVLQMPYGQVDRICKLVPYNPANPVSLRQAIDGEPVLEEMRRSDENVAHLIGIALKLEGLYRHASTHAAGVVIGGRPLAELVPLYRDPRHDALVTQFNMKDIERAGLVKFDFLGLKTLSVLAAATAMLRTRGVEVDLLSIPLDDARTFDLLSAGDTTGVFQLESGGMRSALRSLKPDRFEDIVAVVALYRPGPMENIPSYTNRKHGREKPDTLHPMLEPILRETYGIIIYQEQVMQIAQTLAGYSPGGADLLRRAMGKKIKSEMEAQRESFVSGAVRNGVDRERASHVFDLVEKFAGYGFNKSHAAAYALIAYQTAWLKANHPVVFFAASMSYDIGSPDKLSAFRREMTRCGVALLPPDVNASEARFSVENGAVRYALGAIKNVGEQAMRTLAAERRNIGRFADVADLMARLDPAQINRRQLECLVKAGALDTLDGNRRRLFENIESLLRYSIAASSERASKQDTLFGALGGSLRALPPSPQFEDWSQSDRLRHEYEAIGFYLSAHPLDGQEKLLAKLGVVRCGEIGALIEMGGAAALKLVGVALSYRQRSSAKGAKYAVVQMSDPSGMFEVLAFSEVLAANRDLLERAVQDAKPLIVDVEAQRRDDETRLFARSIQPLDAALARVPAILEVFVGDLEAVRSLRALMDKEPSGQGIVRLKVAEGAEEIELELPARVALSGGLRQAVKAIPGVVDVETV